MIIIDSDSYTASGIETMFFPGDGMPHAKCSLDLKGDIFLVLRMRNWSDIGIGVCVSDMLFRNPRINTVRIFAPYWPCRQDRSDGTAPLTAEILSDLFPYSINVFDVHSDLAQDVAKHSSIINWDPTDLLIDYNEIENVVGIIAPDKGAVTRANNFREKFCPTAILIECAKKRDSRTGELSGYTVPELPKIGKYLIVDDICDGGGTFNLLAEEFDKDPKGKISSLNMFVSHGLFSKGIHAISPRISRIITTDSFYKPRPEMRHSGWNRVTCIPLEQLYRKIQGE